MRDKRVLDKDAIRFNLKISNLGGLELRMKRAAVEHWTPEAVKVLFENGNKKIRDTIAWNCLFAPNIPPIVQRVAVDLRVRDRSDCVWQAVLRIHAIIPGLGEGKRLVKCDKNATALIRLTHECRTVRDMCDALQWILADNIGLGRRWEAGVRRDDCFESMFIVQSFVLDRFRRFCSCVVFESPRDELTAELVGLLRIIIMKGNNARAVGCALFFVCRWGTDFDLMDTANAFWMTPFSTGSSRDHLDDCCEEFGVCVQLLRERLASYTEEDGDVEPLRSLYLLLNLYLEHPKAGKFDDTLSTDDEIKKLAKRLDTPMLHAIMIRLLGWDRLELLSRLVTPDADKNVMYAWSSSDQLQSNMQRLIDLLLERDAVFPGALRVLKLTVDMYTFSTTDRQMMDQLDALSVLYGTPILVPDLVPDSDPDSVTVLPPI